MSSRMTFPNGKTAAGKTAEHERILANRERSTNWKRWGPYLSERQWGTVREDYSVDGEAWSSFSHDDAPSRVYRWGEDGLLGFTDRQCRLCFAVALWNHRDPILKERLFGLTGPEGSHGEDVKEYYYYVDATPTHSYCRAIYKYPQAEYPYSQLRSENLGRDKQLGEFELRDTGVMDEHRYFDVQIEYAKAAADDIVVRITVTNRGSDPAPLSVLPTIWFRNTWVWGCRHEGCGLKPHLQWTAADHLVGDHESLGAIEMAFASFELPDSEVHPTPLATENETNTEKLYGTPQYTTFVKDAFHRYVVAGKHESVNPSGRGTKAAASYEFVLGGGETATWVGRWRVGDQDNPLSLDDAESIVEIRKHEADQFYNVVIPHSAGDDERTVSRQAYAGLLWTKQFYHYIVQDWLEGDLHVAPPPDERWQGRNKDWQHLYARDVISMPDKWEYPWFAAWDLAFHMIPMATVDPDFAKRQLMLLLREWYMHPNGQLPAYEYGFHDVNPPVHAWACLRVYQITGSDDRVFLTQAFQRLLLNFTWWVNRLDSNGDNVFAGGFLGLDNIGIFDRSKPLPTGGHLEQADGTAWMAFYCGTMLSIALELAKSDSAYADMASKFLDHFVRITDAINTLDGSGLWNDEDQFYYDHLHIDHHLVPLKVRSLVGLLPLIAVTVIDRDLLERLPSFQNRLDWFLKYRHELSPHITVSASGERILLAVPTRERLEQTIQYMVDESEFLSPYGIRSLSRWHEQNPYQFHVDGETHEVRYVPGESDSWMFGGNSNWRGPIWFPVNYLLIESLQVYHQFYGDDLTVEYPRGSGERLSLAEVASRLNERLSHLFLADEQGQRPCHGANCDPHTDCHDQSLVLFHEYFDPETGRGLGASHQTGWTALIATCIAQLRGGPV